MLRTMNPLRRLCPPLPGALWCGCLDRVPLRRACRDVTDELLELIKEPSYDELSDVCFGIGRLLGSLTGVPYRPVPFAGPHIEKVAARMQEYGCVRSRRHLRDGHCPSL